MLAFCVALLIGVQATQLISKVAVYRTLPTAPEVSEINEVPPALPPFGVRIAYIGHLEPIPGTESNLQFLIYNGSSSPISCIGYRGVCAKPDIFIREHAESAWKCMNGADEYTIKPGETGSLAVIADDFTELPGETENVTVGYTFWQPGGSPIQSSAEPIVLPSAFRDQVRKAVAERNSYWD